MNIVREQPDPRPERWQQWHILTVGESGFSMLDIYGRIQRRLDIDVIRQFAARINETDESGTLHPRASISAIPCRLFREQANSTDPAVIDDFRRHVAAFIEANGRTIRAKNILVDFHVSSAPVPLKYIEATEQLFRNAGPESPVKEVVIFT